VGWGRSQSLGSGGLPVTPLHCLFLKGEELAQLQPRGLSGSGLMTSLWPNGDCSYLSGLPAFPDSLC
jgi:hypothetical protein